MIKQFRPTHTHGDSPTWGNMKRSVPMSLCSNLCVYIKTASSFHASHQLTLATGLLLPAEYLLSAAFSIIRPTT